MLTKIIKAMKKEKKREYPNLDLAQKDAVTIYNILMTSNDPVFLEKIKTAMESNAGSRMGHWAMFMAWFGTEIPNDVWEKIENEFHITNLQNRNLISPWHEEKLIELNVLASALPDEILLPYFNFSMEKAAVEAHTTIEYVKELVERYVSLENSQRGERLRIRAQIDKDDLNLLQKVIGIGLLMQENDSGFIAYGRSAIENFQKLNKPAVFKDPFSFLENSDGKPS